MNNFKTTDTGGLPIRLDDFRFIHAATMEALKALASPWVESLDAVIFSGCASTDLGSGNYSYDDGFVYFGGEIYYFSGISSTTLTPANAAFYVVETDDLTGARTFKDSTTHDLYKVRQANLGDKATYPTYEYLLTNDVQYSILKKINTPLNWSTLTGGSNPSSSPVFIAINNLGVVYFRGKYTYPSSLTSYDIGILPTWMRPLQQMKGYVPISAATLTLATYIIDTNGHITLNVGSGVSMGEFHLENLPPMPIT